MIANKTWKLKYALINDRLHTSVWSFLIVADDAIIDYFSAIFTFR